MRKKELRRTADVLSICITSLAVFLCLLISGIHILSLPSLRQWLFSRTDWLTAIWQYDLLGSAWVAFSFYVAGNLFEVLLRFVSKAQK